MKKIFSLLFLILSSFSLFSEIPMSLCGIWEGKDRYVFFEKNEETGSDEIVIILKDYYGWYMDRVVENEVYSEKSKRDRNSATTRKSVYVLIDALPLWISEGSSEEESFSYELKLGYSNSEITLVPFAVIDDSMFLNFWISDAEHPGFWKGNVQTDGIKVSNQNEKENLWSWYKNEETGEVYKIRYWKNKMDFDSELEAVIKAQKSEEDYTVPKHIYSAGQNYTCVPGRRVYIRNLDKTPVTDLFDGSETVMNAEETLCALNNVYLKKLADKNTFEELMKIVREKNSRRKPDPPPLFPPEELDYHWDLIDYLEKENVIIQKVRQRQKDFGVRGKDMNR